jgi:hypothetical protein
MLLDNGENRPARDTIPASRLLSVSTLSLVTNDSVFPLTPLASTDVLVDVRVEDDLLLWLFVGLAIQVMSRE